MDDLDLPPVPQSARTAAQTPPRPSFLLSRKRTHADYDDEPATSSDPAFFSSDEQAPGAENYVADKRKKRTYKGSWWDRHPVKEGSRHGTRNRKFKRNYDSGIFMGSESTEEPLSSDSFSMEEELMGDLQRARESQGAQTRPWGGSGLDASYPKPRAKLPPQPAVLVSKEHEAVCAVIRNCLEKGKEDVDLSSMSLSSLPSEVSSLQTLSKQDEIVPGMLDTGTDLEPHLRLYLSNNLFTKFPAPILDLRNLRVLSLRQNNLTYLPPTIRELINLETLNVAGNNLTELPFEIIELIKFHKLQQLTTEPNPWRQFEHPSRLAWTNAPVEHVSAQPGSPLKFFLHASSQAYPESELNVERGFTNVPSLTEMVLRQLSKMDPQQMMDLGSFMPPDSPIDVLRSLDLLVDRSGQQCTTCKRPIVLTGKEWVEWWCVMERTSLLGGQPLPILPFRRVQCWHGCRGAEADWLRDEESTNRNMTPQLQIAAAEAAP